MECPYCLQENTLEPLVTPLIEIHLCNQCHSAWEILNGERRLLVPRKLLIRETFEDFLECLKCGREMKLDEETWTVKCPDPICGFSRFMQGNPFKYNNLQRAIKEKRKLIFDLTYLLNEPPTTFIQEFKDLKKQLIKMEEDFAKQGRILVRDKDI